MCAYCEKPFEGRRHYEKKGLAYCERDYQNVSLKRYECVTSHVIIINYIQLFGDVCFYCNKPCKGDGELLKG